MAKSKYPIYVISKGRWESGYTARFLIKDGIDFHLVVEPQETDAYAREFGRERIYELPFSNLGLGGIPARNWCWEHSRELGAERHWILDDNIKAMRHWENKKRIICNSQEGFSSVEKFIDGFQNIAIAGINYSMFGFSSNKLPPYYLNSRVYSCLLILNSIPYRWRGRYNEDTDLCLQVLSSGLWCTLNCNIFLVDKMQTMIMKGGNSDELYKGNGRLKMARSLELAWKHHPGLVKTTWKYGRPQHHVNWRRFKTPLRRRPLFNAAE